MPIRLRLAWNRTLLELTLLVVVATGVGYVIGYPWQALSASLLGVILWHYWRLRALLTRLSARRRVPPKVREGIWHELDRMLYRGQSETRHGKKRLVQMLRAYRATGAALPDALLIVDRKTQQLIWFNQAAQPLLGLRYPEDIDHNVTTSLPSLPLRQMLDEGADTDPREVRSPVNDDMSLSIRLIPYSKDLWMLVARDVSRLVRLEEMRRDFVANVSHELRTPLTVIHGYLDMLDPEDYPDLAPVLAEMSRQSDRMSNLVEDLLTLSRLEAQGITIERNRVDMLGMLETLRADAEGLSQGRHTILVEGLTNVDVLGSAQELHSAFSNLVSNAIRYTPTDGRIIVRWYRTGDGGAVLSVADTGFGIPASHLPRLTERFYRVSNSRSRTSGGTGLGLAIAKHILNLHDAHLEISSEVGLGSTFSCIFGPSSVLDAAPQVADRNPMADTAVAANGSS